MAEKKEAEEKAPPKKRGKLLLFIIIGALVLVLAVGGGAYMLIKKKNKAAAEDGDDPVASEQEKKKDRPDAPPVFVKLEPFTVKLQPDQQTESYVQVVPELRVLDVQTGDKVKLYVPEIRHKILMLLSGKKAQELADPKGLQKLANEMRDEINLIIDGPPTTKNTGKLKTDAPAEPKDQPRSEDSVQAVLFTSFVIQ